jgi:hypothetical protein
MKKIQNVQVSDTTGDEQGKKAGNKKIKKEKSKIKIVNG